MWTSIRSLTNLRSLGLGLLLLAGPSVADASYITELDEIQTAIESTDAAWTAGPNHIAEMEPDARRQLLGVIREEPVDALSERPVGMTLPSSWDWRDMDGQDFLTPVKNQGSCGSCVAFGVNAALEASLEISDGDDTWNPDLSEQHLFSCGGGGCNFGWYVSSALNYARFSGIPGEDCNVYLSGIMGDRDCSRSCDDWEDKTVQIDAWSWVTNDVDAIKSYLMDQPLVTTMDVYTDFYAYTSGVYSHTWGGYEGGHCITFVGWDDADSCWIVKNSWGANWGEDGYFRIAYGDSDIGSQTAWMSGYPTIRPSTDASAYAAGASADLGISLHNVGAEIDGLIEVWAEASNGKQQVLYSGSHVIPEGTEHVDATALSDPIPSVPAGVYTVYSAVRSDNGSDTHSCAAVEVEITN